MSVLLGNAEKHVRVEIGLSDGMEIWSFELHVFGEGDPTTVNWEVALAEEELVTGKVPDTVAQELGAWLATEGAEDIFPEVVRWLRDERRTFELSVKRMTAGPVED